MRTTGDLPDGLMEDVARLTGARKKKDALRIALEEYVRRVRIEALLALPGTIDIEDVSEEFENLELEEERLTLTSISETLGRERAKSTQRKARVAEQRKRYH